MLHIIKLGFFMQSEIDIEQPLVEAKPVSIFALFKFSDSFDKLLMLFGTLGAMASGASMPFFMVFFSQISLIFIDSNKANAQKQSLQVAIKFFILGGVTWFLNFLGLYCWGMTGKRQTIRFKKMYYKTLLDQEVAWYDSNDVNKLSTQISTNMVAVETAIGQKISILLTVMITSTFGFFYAYFTCWQLSLVLTAFLPLSFFAGMLVMKSFQLKAQISKVSYQGASAIAQQAFSSIRTIKTFVSETFEENRFIKALSQSQKTVVKYILTSAGGLAFMTLVYLGLYSLGFYYGKQLIIWDIGYSAPTVISTFLCFLIGGSSIGQISPLMRNIVQGKVAAASLYKLIERQRTLIEPEPGIHVNQLAVISFKNISFKYEKVKDQIKPEQSSKTKPKDLIESSQNIKQQKMNNSNEGVVLNGVSLQFKKGKVTALVGESGSGKSTIIQLLMRYYDPTNGGIFINDVNMKDVDIKKFRRKIGYVGQEPVLFSMTIAQNLRLSNPDLTDQQIQQILKKANAWQFVSKCQKGIDTYVGSSGAQISGGQKQRIAIARALAKQPMLLVLDQATSALDRKNEKQIQKTLQNLSEGNITTIVVAHRLSTIKNADKIIVMGKGKILEQGTHSELFSKQGPYHELVKSQMSSDVQNNVQINEEIKQQEEKMQSTENFEEQAVQNTKKQQKKQEQKKYTKEQLDGVFRKLFRQSSGSYGYLFLGAISAIINGLVWPFFNIAFSNIFALMGAASQNSDEINKYCILFLVVAVTAAVTTFLFSFCFDLVGNRVVFSLRKKLFIKLLNLPVSYYDKSDNTPGGISTKLSQDSYQINNMITGVLAVLCLNVATISTSLIFALYYSWKLTLIVLAISPLLVASSTINMRVVKSMGEKSEKYEKAVGSMVSDSVCNIRTVKSFGNQTVFMDLFSNKLQQISKIGSQRALKTAILQGLAKGSLMFVEGFTFWIAGILYANNQIDEPKGIYIAIMSIVFAAMGVGQNSAFMPDLGKAKLAGASLFEILESKDQLQQAKEFEEKGLKSIKGDIQFKNVSFKYPERQAIVLKNFNLKIKQGQKIAFVGPSGSGKSTIIQILMRFYQIQQGQILINGHDYKKFNLQAYRKQIGLVSQEPTLFLGTVKENIIYNTTVKEQKVNKKLKKNCKIVHALNFINQWPQKFDKEVGQKGTQVSGGQKQRIALARCLMRKPKIILLDQSTSALDVDTQKIVFQNLKPILKKTTSISIAHRLSTIEDSDRIIVMRDGQVIEQGGYEQLMAKKENFYRLAKGTD